MESFRSYKATTFAATLYVKSSEEKKVCFTIKL